MHEARKGKIEVRQGREFWRRNCLKYLQCATHCTPVIEVEAILTVFPLMLRSGRRITTMTCVQREGTNVVSRLHHKTQRSNLDGFSLEPREQVVVDFIDVMNIHYNNQQQQHDQHQQQQQHQHHQDHDHHYYYQYYESIMIQNRLIHNESYRIGVKAGKQREREASKVDICYQ